MLNVNPWQWNLYRSVERDWFKFWNAAALSSSTPHRPLVNLLSKGYAGPRTHAWAASATNSEQAHLYNSNSN